VEVFGRGGPPKENVRENLITKDKGHREETYREGLSLRKEKRKVEKNQLKCRKKGADGENTQVR